MEVLKMSCCGNHKHKNENDHGQHHADKGKNTNKWMLGQCCIIPVVVIGILLFAKVTIGFTGDTWILALLLICPLSHFLIMPLLNKKKKNQHTLN